MSQLLSGASQTAATVARASKPSMTAIARRVGRVSSAIGLLGSRSEAAATDMGYRFTTGGPFPAPLAAGSHRLRLGLSKVPRNLGSRNQTGRVASGFPEPIPAAPARDSPLRPRNDEGRPSGAPFEKFVKQRTLQL